MKASIIAANALLIIGIATMHGVDPGRPAGVTTREAVTATIGRSACSDAVWPYVPAECGAHGVVRPVRILAAGQGR
ncbi:hypothetical protein [Methylobacterium gnaphalii]|uniref:Uncharacterized protein n=1 Tax=Methylobacterium gnaphalii TaxID=1010610 RepID=A0A512JQC0_9HYPH|nr:hypothetical protein [Methylobacterium gnaphalii]GEP12154.1 hypothetical protein MGN01_39990 [Methylobacterium gnaphalii]GJD70018.1 hypothetical protein MMMDOFMJ_2958 [Methylobacterium gnaphalii]GLS48913.1 hypothetical protein GCM10007885_17600 [Methylobacterium gnaphalii]